MTLVKRVSIFNKNQGNKMYFTELARSWIMEVYMLSAMRARVHMLSFFRGFCTGRVFNHSLAEKSRLASLKKIPRLELLAAVKDHLICLIPKSRFIFGVTIPSF